MPDSSFATPAALAGVWRPLTTAEAQIASNLLRYASALVRHQVPDVDDRITAGTLNGSVVELVVVEMVKRRMQNPEGLRSETKSIDDFSHAVTRDQEHSAGGLYLTDAELASLQTPKRGAFSITPYRAPTTEADLEAVARLRAARECG